MSKKIRCFQEVKAQIKKADCKCVDCSDDEKLGLGEYCSMCGDCLTCCDEDCDAHMGE